MSARFAPRIIGRLSSLLRLRQFRRGLPPGAAVGRGACFLGDYASWREALDDSSGYDAPRILEKALGAILKVKAGKAAYERDTVLFDRIEYSFPLLVGLLLAGSRDGGRLRVLDFGGALGSSYFQNRRMLAHFPDFMWGVVEQEHFVDCGRANVADEHLRFYHSIDECVDALRPNFVLLSGVLSYLEEPYAMASEILRRQVPFLCLDRSFVSLQGGTRLTVQVVPPTIYEASYPCWILDERELVGFIRETYRLVYDFPSLDGGEVRLDGLHGTFKGYLFARPDVAAAIGVS